MNYLGINNPQLHTTVIPYAAYSTHKNARKQIQTQRQQAQHTTSHLERQAKRSAKQLENKQLSLMSYYRLKESRFEESLKKQKLRKKRQEQLQTQRKTNTLFRQTSSAKKTMARQNLLKTNHQSFYQIKIDRSENERRLSQQKKLQNQLLKRRNSAFSKAVAFGMEHAKVKSFFDKRAQSSEVKKDLIFVQERIKNRQINTIDYLNARQKELLEIVDRNKKRKQHIESTYEKFQSTPFYQLYPIIKNDNISKKSRSRKGSLKSQSLYVL